MGAPKRVLIPVFDGVDLFDVTGPVEVLGTNLQRPSPFELVLVSMSSSLRFTTTPAITMEANCTRDDCPQGDILLVPGGPGVDLMMWDAGVKAWLQQQAAKAEWVTSVCAGSLLLAAAGLLDDHIATTHWASRDALGLFPEVTLADGYPRVVTCRNRMTSGGVSSAVDLAITLKAKVLGDQAGKDVELMLQYDPDPPFKTGTPDLADPVTQARCEAFFKAPVARRVRIIEELLRNPDA